MNKILLVVGSVLLASCGPQAQMDQETRDTMTEFGNAEPVCINDSWGSATAVFKVDGKYGLMEVDKNIFTGDDIYAREISEENVERFCK